jgi:hypothetical protein
MVIIDDLDHLDGVNRSPVERAPATLRRLRGCRCEDKAPALRQIYGQLASTAGVKLVAPPSELPQVFQARRGSKFS